MQDLTSVRLENEMDIILAYKRAMKLAELAGLSLSAQTTFATAVSEVARTTCDGGRCGSLVLSVDAGRSERYIVATLHHQQDAGRRAEGIEYAKRLVNRLDVTETGSGFNVALYYAVAPPFRLDVQRIDEWRQALRNEPPVSPYEELKQRTEQLQELTERVQKSEAQYKTLTNALPLIIFSLNTSGELVYANEWLSRYTGRDTEQLNRTRWSGVVHPDDYDAFAGLLLRGPAPDVSTVRLQVRLRQEASGDWLWHQVTLTSFRSERGDLQYWIGYIADIHAQKIVEETLKDNRELKEAQAQLRMQQEALQATIAELNRSNQELQQFAYIASHDLQEPVRKVLYYSDYLADRYDGMLDGRGAEYLRNMQAAAHRMRALIRDTLAFSQINRGDAPFAPVSLNALVADALQDLELTIAEKQAEVSIEALPSVDGDAPLLRQLFANIIGNSLKYARPDTPPVVRIQSVAGAADETVIALSDNGIGFDQKYLPQLFGLFQRLHRSSETGTGIGLAICKKIMDVHGGRIWADSEEGKGTTFYVSFPASA